jgi:putative transposase
VRRYATHANRLCQTLCYPTDMTRLARAIVPGLPHHVNARYIELNPVRAKLVSRAEDYPWSSARAHLLGRDDALVTAASLLARVPEWRTFLGADAKTDDDGMFRRHETTGRPLGADAFISHGENLLGRVLRRRKPGPIAAGRAGVPLPP